MIDAHEAGSGHTLYELGRIALGFGAIFLGTWIVIKLILRSGKRGVSAKQLRSNRQQRRTERAQMKRKRRQSAYKRRRG